MVKAHGTVTVTQLVDEPSDPDDRRELPAGAGGKGSAKRYDVSVEFGRTRPRGRDEGGWTEAEEWLLNAFHKAVSIGRPEDFRIGVRVEAEPEVDGETRKLADQLFAFAGKYFDRLGSEATRELETIACRVARLEDS